MRLQSRITPRQFFIAAAALIAFGFVGIALRSWGARAAYFAEHVTVDLGPSRIGSLYGAAVTKRGDVVLKKTRIGIASVTFVYYWGGEDHLIIPELLRKASVSFECFRRHQAKRNTRISLVVNDRVLWAGTCPNKRTVNVDGAIATEDRTLVRFEAPDGRVLLRNVAMSVDFARPGRDGRPVR